MLGRPKIILYSPTGYLPYHQKTGIRWPSQYFRVIGQKQTSPLTQEFGNQLSALIGVSNKKHMPVIESHQPRIRDQFR